MASPLIYYYNMNETPHIIRDFDSSLKGMKASVLHMAAIAGGNLDNAVHGLLQRNEDLCNDAIAEDEEVNAYERSIDKEGMEILLRFNPLASDLRAVVASMKVSTNLERIADQSENIARRARKIIKKNEVPEIQLIKPVHALAASLVAEAVRAFSDGNSQLALTLFDKDQELDRLHKKAIKDLTRAIEKDQENLRTYLNLIFIVRCLERIGDHAVNIGEDTVYIEEAADIRHIGPAALEEEE
ncbi:MAG: phosphate signaling complex protein PhoU [Verrucomicrobiales bacterium]|nr:phosphate signaling complex protein PhoU [Verrucomicrobiales bacterium]